MHALGLGNNAKGCSAFSYLYNSVVCVNHVGGGGTLNLGASSVTSPWGACYYRALSVLQCSSSTVQQRLLLYCCSRSDTIYDSTHVAINSFHPAHYWSMNMFFSLSRRICMMLITYYNRHTCTTVHCTTVVVVDVPFLAS